MNKKKKFMNLFTATAVSTVAVAAVPGFASAAQFSDIEGDTHQEAIGQLVNMGIINGYPDGTFKPYKELTYSDVVKLIGKYLKANGFNIPTDYKTNFRFLDTTANTEDELLQYAALLKDEGILTNQLLNPSEAITREDMAVLLANTLSTIHQFDIYAYVNAQQFEKEVTDLNEAKGSAQSSINVLDYFDITKVSEFRPKDSLTRGQFASFLQRLTNIKSEELFRVKKVEVSGNQLIVQFNESVNLSSTTNSEEIAKYFSLTGKDLNAVKASKGQLSEDGTSYVITFDSLEGNYNLIVNAVPSKTGKHLPQFAQQVFFEKVKNEPTKDTEESVEKTKYIVESENFILGVKPNGAIVDGYDSTIKVYGFVDGQKVKLPNSGYNITINSDYLTINGNKVSANIDAIKADGILDDDKTYEAEIVITINQTGEQLKHTIKLSSEKVKANGKFRLINKNSISEKSLTSIDVEISDDDFEISAMDLFHEIDKEGYFDIEDQYGNEAEFNPTTGLVTFADGSSREIRPIITNISTANKNYKIFSNGTTNLTISIGENGLSQGDSFDLKLTIDDASVTVRVYLK